MPLDPERNNPLDGIRNMVQQGGIPVTTTVLLANVATAVIAFFAPAIPAIYSNFLWCDPATLLWHPWTLFSYPFVDIIPNNGVLFWWFLNAFFFWLSSGSVERSWGSSKYIVLFVSAGVIGGLSIALGYAITHVAPFPYPVHGFFLPMLAGIVAFCCLRTEAPVSFLFVPMKAKYIALIAVAMAFLEYGRILGFFALIPLICAYFYVTRGRAWADVDHYT